ncbi:hypothetical protein [Sphingorhabdus sp.]|uniref:hypothetical protein n=1 Tax=Sphingorhabdus sp. TaxID=1902408 RepID=UPI0039193115
MNIPVKSLSPFLANTSAIIGWGIDADPNNDPTYPIRNQLGDRGLTRQWSRPPVQQPHVEILQSIEHLRQPAVVGTSTPPKGLSGMLRRRAFRWSESNWLHWLILLGADRINVVEGIITDLLRGRILNIPAEMGIRSELRYNKSGFIKKLLVMTFILVSFVALAFWIW